MNPSSRRDFLKTAAGAVSAAGFGLPAPAPAEIKKGLVYDMLPKRMNHADRCRLARDCGFAVVQASTTPDGKEAETIKNAAGSAGLRIDSVMNLAHWEFPLSSAAAIADLTLTDDYCCNSSR